MLCINVLGLALPIVMQVCQGFSLWFTLKQGAAPWDAMPGHELRSRPLWPARIVIFVLLFLALLTALPLVLEPVSDAFWDSFWNQLFERMNQPLESPDA